MAAVSRVRVAPRPLSSLVGVFRTRSYAAAAAVRLEYESDDDAGLGGSDRRVVGATADSCGDENGRGVHWVFMGSPSAHKHVCATRMAALLGVPYITMGSLVRRELHPRSSLYKQISNAVNEGKLVPEGIIFGLLSQRLEEGYFRGERGFILGGIPRTQRQAEILDQIADIDLVVNLKCPEGCSTKKHMGGETCSHCGVSVNHSDATTSKSCLPTDIQHPQLKSASDSGESCSQKLHICIEQSQLSEDYYRRRNKLLDFQVSGGPKETLKGLLAALHLPHLDAVNSSPTLTA